MSEDWAVGDLAVCVDDRPCPFYGPHPDIKAGRIYTVAEVLPRNGLRLAGIVSYSPSGGFATRMFRKIRPDSHEGSAEDWALILETTKRKVRA